MAEINLEPWRPYLAAFDGYLRARARGDRLAAIYYRTSMRLELECHEDTPSSNAGPPAVNGRKGRRDVGDLVDERSIADPSEWGPARLG